MQTIAMNGPSGATASIALIALDKAGNWPMTLEVKGLPALPTGKTYTLWLTKAASSPTRAARSSSARARRRCR